MTCFFFSAGNHMEVLLRSHDSLNHGWRDQWRYSTTNFSHSSPHNAEGSFRYCFAFLSCLASRCQTRRKLQRRDVFLFFLFFMNVDVFAWWSHDGSWPVRTFWVHEDLVKSLHLKTLHKWFILTGSPVFASLCYSNSECCCQRWCKPVIKVLMVFFFSTCHVISCHLCIAVYRLYLYIIMTW